MTNTQAVQWVRQEAKNLTGTGPDLADPEKRVLLAIADLAGEGTGVAVDVDVLAEHADVNVLGLASALSKLHGMGLLARSETTMAGRLRLLLPIPGRADSVTINKETTR